MAAPVDHAHEKTLFVSRKTSEIADEFVIRRVEDRRIGRLDK
jgi:hypothetical protein